ncbi:hypothetical protein PAPYR_11725 [Paratrimastix pyriformis]|uniref:Uncharacterized protein n=1 Tax=Paratrimastix pyriformis TaxID=342808 RepID=A0ABQ8U375_9EUKA|nr:hypothetical protein PAPYR_11725 [Paratrimastix pyriformis]
MSIFNSGSYGRYTSPPCQPCERPCCGLVSLVNVPVVTLSALYGILVMALPSRVSLVVRPCNCAGLTRLFTRMHKIPCPNSHTRRLPSKKEALKELQSEERPGVKPDHAEESEGSVDIPGDATPPPPDGEDDVLRDWDRLKMTLPTELQGWGPLLNRSTAVLLTIFFGARECLPEAFVSRAIRILRTNDLKKEDIPAYEKLKALGNILPKLLSARQLAPVKTDTGASVLTPKALITLKLQGQLVIAPGAPPLPPWVGTMLRVWDKARQFKTVDGEEPRPRPPRYLDAFQGPIQGSVARFCTVEGFQEPMADLEALCIQRQLDGPHSDDVHLVGWHALVPVSSLTPLGHPIATRLEASEPMGPVRPAHHNTEGSDRIMREKAKGRRCIRVLLSVFYDETRQHASKRYGYIQRNI